MAATVAMPLERSLGRIAGITEMTSASALGTTRVVLQFELDRDINGAARDVQAALNAARSALPSGLNGNPTYRKVNPADAPVMILALTSNTMTQGPDVRRGIDRHRPEAVAGLGRGPGPGPAAARCPPCASKSIRRRCTNTGIGFEDVRAALAGPTPTGQGAVEDDRRYWQIEANDQAATAADYLSLIVAYRNGAPVGPHRRGGGRRLRAGSAQRRFGERQAVGVVIISRQPNANIIETVDRVTALLPAFARVDPGGHRPRGHDGTHDDDPRLAARCRADSRAVGGAGSSWSCCCSCATAAARSSPASPSPVSLTATFGIMYLAGYSLDNLSPRWH